MTSPSDIDQLKTKFLAELETVSSQSDLQDLRDRYLGRKRGAVAVILKTVAQAPTDQRPSLGSKINKLKKDIEQALLARKKVFSPLQDRTNEIDVTLTGRKVLLGHRHPLTILREEIEDIFLNLGFEILQGPEAENEYHNFEALNMPAAHPARDMQDTFYLQDALPPQQLSSRPATLLRTHTSGMQIRYMETRTPPVRIIAPGLVYRRDNPDPTHSPMFQQIEGLLVGDRVTMTDLKGTLECFLQQLFSSDTHVMFRPSFFPYTEPSAEVFITCVFCNGDGCSICKKTGWLEVLGSGMVHPTVFEAVGYDPERYTGWAFGVGIDRLALLKYRVEDIRLFYDNDLRLLEQFSF